MKSLGSGALLVAATLSSACSASRPRAADTGPQPAHGPTQAPPAGPASSKPTSAAPTPPGSDEIVVGSKVVVAPEGDFLLFLTGTVTAVDGSSIVWERAIRKVGRMTSMTPRSRVYRADVPPRPPIQADEFVICIEDETELLGPCRVSSVGKAIAYCQNRWGYEFECDPLHLVRPSPEVQDDIRSNLERQAHYRSFQAAARAAGKPVVKQGWKPKPGTKILIHNSANGDWYVGVVKAIRKGELVVKEQVSWDVTLEDDTEIVPVPTRPERASVGQYVLFQQAPDHWECGLISGIEGDRFKVVDGWNEATVVSATDIVPLE